MWDNEESGEKSPFSVTLMHGKEFHLLLALMTRNARACSILPEPCLPRESERA